MIGDIGLLFHVYGNLGDYLSLNLWCTIKSVLFMSKRNNHVGYSKEMKKYSAPPVLELPFDVMEIIAQHLCLRSHIYMSSVCKSWRELFIMPKSNIMYNPPTLPWILLPGTWGVIPPAGETEREVISVYSMFDDRVVDFNLPKSLITRGIRGLWCYGSSRGWLLVGTDISDISNCLFLLNPIFGITLDLPSLTTLPFYKEYIDKLPQGSDTPLPFFQQIEVSPLSNNQDVVIAMMFHGKPNSAENVLAICKPNDKAWTIFEGDRGRHVYGAMRFYQGMLYVTKFVCVGGWDIEKEPIIIGLKNGMNLELKFIFVCCEHRHTSDEFWKPQPTQHRNVNTYLVESMRHELLLVIQKMMKGGTGDNDGKSTYKTRRFIIYKNHTVGGMRRVAGLGDQALLLACGTGISSLAKRNSGSLVRGNSIYFKHWSLEGPEELGVFYLEDSKIEHPNRDAVNHHFQSLPCWLTGFTLVKHS